MVSNPSRLPRILAAAHPGVLALIILGVTAAARAQAPQPGLVESPSIKVLQGLTAPVFEEEMRQMVQALGVTCGYCHPRGNFSSDEIPRKVIARRMIELTKATNAQFFPDYRPKDGESILGKVTCYTCHQGETTPKTGPG